MIGRVCKIFPGHTLSCCLNMTTKQLYGLYWESMRQEARTKLATLQIETIMKGGKGFKNSIVEIERQAYPPDPEADGDFSSATLKDLFRQVGK